MKNKEHSSQSVDSGWVEDMHAIIYYCVYKIFGKKKLEFEFDANALYLSVKEHLHILRVI